MRFHQIPPHLSYLNSDSRYEDYFFFVTAKNADIGSMAMAALMKQSLVDIELYYWLFDLYIFIDLIKEHELSQLPMAGECCWPSHTLAWPGVAEVRALMVKKMLTLWFCAYRAVMMLLQHDASRPRCARLRRRRLRKSLWYAPPWDTTPLENRIGDGQCWEHFAQLYPTEYIYHARQQIGSIRPHFNR